MPSRARSSSPERAPRAVRRGGLALTAALTIVVLFLRSDSEVTTSFGTAPFDRPTTVRVRLRSLGEPPWTVSGAPLRRSGRSDGLAGDLTLDATGERVLIDGETGDPTVELESGDGVVRIDGKRYVGRVVVAAGDRPRPVVLVELEQYVEQVLPREMPLSFPRAALQAQAVAIRSYVVNEIRRRRKRAWDVVDTELSQVFGGAATADRRARDVVSSVAGVVLAWNERPLPAFFSSTCGGRTRGAHAAFGGDEPPPLSGGPCGFCKWSREYRWGFTVGVEEFRRAANLRSPPRRVVWEPGDDDRGVVIAITRGGRARLSSGRLRGRLGGRRMRSTWVTGAELQGAGVRLEGRGFGHGVGMCQNGARGMADAGYDMIEILEHYYPGAEPVKLRP